MKKIIPLLLVIALLAGCGSSGATMPSTLSAAVEEAEQAVASAVEQVVETTEEPVAEATEAPGNIVVNDNRNQGDTATDPAAPADTATFTDADFEITGEYLYENSFGTSMYFVTVRNNSSATVDISGNAAAKDAEGNLIGADSMSIDALGPGEESIGYFYFSDVSGISTVEYSLSYSEPWLYQAVLSNLSVQQTLNDSNVTLQVTNNGAINAQFVEAYALFMDADGRVIDYASEYLTDNDFEIKPGATISGQLDYYGDGYDHVLVYLTGYSDGTASEATTIVSDADFERREYLYNNSYSTLYFIVLKNNSAVTVEVQGNATAFDADGNVIGADDMSIDVLGPGEESVGYFYFSDVTGVASVDYQLMYSESSYYEPVIANLSVEASVNDSNVVVAVTNNGDIAAKFVEAYALFFDADGNMVDYGSSYITDDDNEIKPGDMLTEQINTYDPFDHAEIYMTGRGGGF